MANLITIGRLLLLFAAIGMIYRDPVGLALPAMLLVVVVFAGDGLDGWVARKRNSTSRLGAILDIAGDRVVETVFWVVFADLGVIPIWMPIAVITRGAIVDALRSVSYAAGMTAFGERNMMRSPLTRWLTAGRFMRGLYGFAKAAGFVFLAGEVAWSHGGALGTPIGALYAGPGVRAFGWLWVWLSFTLMIVRGLPVIIDAIPALGEAEPRPEPMPPAGMPATTPIEAGAAPGSRG
ncbi:MAG TPA: CDP-alcohol phosphatidyltransferase family protein [Thermomicrobiales bacterium]|nr:CDP-alcohol phosphatidyltransferase family protein [Thermomicrobiales bacterium]